MKNKSIKYKLLLAFSITMITFFIIIAILIITIINTQYKKEYEKKVIQYTNYIEEATNNFLKVNDEMSYEELKMTMELVKTSINMDSIILDSQSYVYAVSNESLDSLNYTKLDIAELDLEKIKAGEIISKKDIIYNNKNLDTYYKPIFYNGKFNGLVILIENHTKSYLSESYKVIFILVIFLSISSIFLIYYFLKKILLKPLEDINISARKLVKGDFKKRIYIDSNDEIGELANSFNIMAESLEKVDLVRKEFIANVSHEIRSPITSIKGFISAILDGVIPSDREDYYLKIVNDEAERLSRLVTDLLDISAMEEGKLNLNIVKMDINEVITLCILNLERRIKEKNLNVEIIFNSDKEYCFGDRDRIIQVIINLVDNAIKYGNEKGKIEIETYSKGDLVYISVFNTGYNIPKENLNKIWERFYKDDKSRTNKISTGLGLPIVRLILTQHNQDIWVENIEGKGVKFTFTLKKQIKI